MLSVLLVIQGIITLALIIVVLLQRSGSDGLSGLGAPSSPDALLSGRASATLMTRTTAILAAAFMANSLLIAVITARQEGFADRLVKAEPVVEAPVEENGQETPTAPIAE